MTTPNRATLWGETIVDELAACGVSAACVAPGSRSTPLTVALAEHPEVETFSILDERSAAYFALGRGKRTGEPTAIVCTSGTAAANFHPAIVEANQSGVPLLALTADRPHELRESGANQTIDQTKLFGDAVRWFRTLPEPAPEPRRLRSVRTTLARAVARTNGPDAGPVHLNVPVAKPLEPTDEPGDVPDDLEATAPLAVTGRDGPFVTTATGLPTLDDPEFDRLAGRLRGATRGLVVVGPRSPDQESRDAIVEFAAASGWPVLADPLSDLRFGDHVEDLPVCGGYDAYVELARDWPDPDAVVRFGASPTSKPLRKYLRDVDATQVVVDPADDWPEAEFTATDHVVADPAAVARGLADRLEGSRTETGVIDRWRSRFQAAESAHWSTVDAAIDRETFEGAVLATVVRAAPDPATVFVSNSMPVRDCDRFGRPRTAELTVLGNRGASGIDGITSSALGAGSATDDPLVLVIGDLAYYHDMNGLLSLTRCDLDATIVLVNNDGGGIFHKLPIENFDPPFTEQFRTPHGLDFEPTGDLYDLRYRRVDSVPALADEYRDAVESGGRDVIEFVVDAGHSHEVLDRVTERSRERVRDRVDSE